MKIIIILFIVFFLNGCFGNTNKYLWKKPVQEVTQEVKNLNNKNEISADELVQQKRKDKKERKEKIAHLSKIGEGSYTWENGDTYDGSWFNLNMNGPGTMYFKNGTKYVGNWKDGIMWGDGILFDIDGSILKQGEWIKGGFKEDVIKRKKIEEQIKIKNKKIKAEEARKKEEAARIAEERRKEIIEEKRIAKEKEIFENAKLECEAIGYKKGTEKFGECVLDLTE